MEYTQSLCKVSCELLLLRSSGSPREQRSKVGLWTWRAERSVQGSGGPPNSGCGPLGEEQVTEELNGAMQCQVSGWSESRGIISPGLNIVRPIQCSSSIHTGPALLALVNVNRHLTSSRIYSMFHWSSDRP